MALHFTQVDDALFRNATYNFHLSYTLWTRTQFGGGSTGVVLQYDDNGNTGDMLYLFAELGSFKVNSGSVSKTLFAFTANVWYFFAVTVSGTNYTAYWSQAGGGGTLNSTSWVDATQPASYIHFAIGDHGANGGLPYLGDIQNVKTWSNVALSAAEVQLEMPSLHPVRTAGLNAWYPLLTVPDRLNDYSGNGATLSARPNSQTLSTGCPASWNF